MSYLARLLLLEVLPKDINRPNRPRVSESVAALAEVNKSNSAIFRIKDNYKGHTDYPVRCAVFSHDGKRIASESCNRIIVWDANNGKLLFDVVQNNLDSSCFHKSGIPIAFSNDDSFIVTVNAYNNSIIIMDSFKDNQMESMIGYHDDEVLSVAISPNDDYIASSSIDGTIKLWNMRMGWQVGEPFEGHKDIINSISFSPDGNRIVSASSDRTIRIWDIQTGKQIGNPIKGHTSGVNSAFFSPDGSHIVSASFDKSIRIWDSKTGLQVGKAMEGHSEVVNSAYYSHDGRFIVSASDDKTIRIWDVSSGQQIGKTLVGHTERIASARFSPDDKRIVSASDDKTIRIWDVDTTLRSYMNKHNEEKNTNASINNNRIVSTFKDDKTHTWDNNSLQQLIDETRERFKDRPLTKEERRKYYLE